MIFLDFFVFLFTIFLVFLRFFEPPLSSSEIFFILSIFSSSSSCCRANATDASSCCRRANALAFICSKFTVTCARAAELKTGLVMPCSAANFKLGIWFTSVDFKLGVRAFCSLFVAYPSSDPSSSSSGSLSI